MRRGNMALMHTPHTEGSHRLVVILRTAAGYVGEAKVVRWCEICGAVVIDLDCDGRTDPGRIMAMKFPASPPCAL